MIEECPQCGGGIHYVKIALEAWDWPFPIRWLLRKKMMYGLFRLYHWSRVKALWKTIRGGKQRLYPPGVRA